MDKFLRSFILLFLSVAVVTTTGCEPLRKKFVRKKKNVEGEEKAGVIYDPMEYPAVVKTSGDIYAQHYSLWKVWVGDLTTSIQENANEKKLQYTLAKMQDELTAMRQFVSDDLQRAIDGYVEEIVGFSLEFKKPAEMRNKSVLLSNLRSLDRRVKDNLSVAKVKDQLRPMS